jgi:hypothetical protein
MRRLLAVGLIVALYLIYVDMQSNVESKRKLWWESQQNKPDSTRVVKEFDWENHKFVYDIIGYIEVDDLDSTDWGFQYREVDPDDKDEDDMESFIDPQLSPYLDQFIEYSYTYGGSLNIRDVQIVVEFDEGIRLIEERVGRCVKGWNYINIKIDPKFWNNYPEYREVIFLHECGHCFLDRAHRNITYKGSIGSLMDENIAGRADDYFKHKLYYLKELFN